MYKKLPTLLTAVFLCLAACESIPQGTPPEDNIVDPFKPPAIYNAGDGIDVMSTALTTACFQNIKSGSSVYLDFNSKLPEFKHLPFRVWHDSSNISGLKTARNRNNPLVLRSRIEQFRRFARWQMKLVRINADGREQSLWKAQIMVVI